MLMLLKPWRRLETNLKLPVATWEATFADFLSTASAHTSKILSGIQYFHDCHASAMRHSMRAEMVQALEGMEVHPDEVMEDRRQQGGMQMILTEETLTDLVAAHETTQEEWHGLLAIEAAKLAKIFDESDGNPPNNTETMDHVANLSRQYQMHSVHTTTAADI